MMIMGRYESPDYQVLHQEGKYSIRHYDQYYTSSVKENSLAGRSGFGVLFSYISGQNEEQEKIAMTVPVINTLDADMTMEFVVPKKYNQGIPNPKDKRIAIKTHPKQEMAIIRFKGFTNQKKLSKVKKLLSNWIKAQGYQASGSFLLARYNPPFVPPCFRKNELMVKVHKKANSKSN
jgi:hypothetical protein